jgi:acylphosphatase
MDEIYATVHGNVQMVAFRDFVKRLAIERGISGSVKNDPDGTVEVIAQGPRDALEELVRLLHKGPQHARVEQVDCVWRQAKRDFDGFHIVY